MCESAARSARVADLVLAMALVLPACAQGEADTGSSGDDAQTDFDAGDDVSARDAAGPPPSSDDAGDDASTQDGTATDDGSPPSDDAPVTEDAPGDDASGDAPSPADAGADTGIDAPADTGIDAPVDAGPDAPPAGCPCAPQFSCVSGSCTPARRVFVSSAVYDGNLGGHAGADAKCQSLATAARLGGTWMAWVSDASSSPSQRFTKASVGYRLVSGTPVAANWAALTGGASLLAAIDLTETGASLATADKVTSRVWTATGPGGALDVASCTNFASNAASVIGEVGHCTFTGTAPTPDGGQPTSWTAAYAKEPCNLTHHLYCFEQ
jgi:hypothetical protein